MDEAPAEAYSKRKTSRENAERRRTWRAAGLATERYRIRFRIRSTTKWRGRGATCQRREPAFLRGVRRADPRRAAQGPPRRAAVRGLSGGSRQGSARRQPLQPPRQQGQPVALKSGDGKIGESFGEGRRNHSGEGLPPPLPKPPPLHLPRLLYDGEAARREPPPDDGMGEARRGRRLSGALRAEASSIKPPIISGGAALCAGRAVSLRRRAVRPGLTSAAWRGITSFSSIRMPRNLM